MKCVACWLATEGAAMTEALFVFGGQSLCADHMTKVYDALEAQPDVNPQ